MEHNYQDIPGYFWFQRAYARLLAELPQNTPSTFVELGSFKGRSMAWLAVEVLNSGKLVTLYAVDQFPGDLLEEFQTNLGPLLRRWVTILPMLTVDAAATFQDGSIDVVWLDADHSYEGCSADIRAWWPKLKPSGWMGGDDLEMEGVQQAVTEHFGAEYEIGPGWADDTGTPRYYPWWLVQKPWA